jgi:hypothetical protein
MTKTRPELCKSARSQRPASAYGLQSFIAIARGCFVFASKRTHSTRQRRYLIASRKAGAAVMVSAFALIVRSPIVGSSISVESLSSAVVQQPQSLSRHCRKAALATLWPTYSRRAFVVARGFHVRDSKAGPLFESHRKLFYRTATISSDYGV